MKTSSPKARKVFENWRWKSGGHQLGFSGGTDDRYLEAEPDDELKSHRLIAVSPGFRAQFPKFVELREAS